MTSIIESDSMTTDLNLCNFSDNSPQPTHPIITPSTPVSSPINFDLLDYSYDLISSSPPSSAPFLLFTRRRIDLQYGAGDNMSHNDRRSGDVATSSIPSPATQGDDSPYEFLNDSLNESMLASPMGDGGVDSPDQLASSQEDASPGVAPAPYYIEVGRGRAYGNQIARDIPYRVRFNEVWAGRRVAYLLDDLNIIFEDVLHQAGQGILLLDLGRVIIVHPDLDNPIVITMRVWHEIRPDLFRQSIQNVLNSNQALTLKTDFQIIVGVVQLPRGEGRLPFLSDDSYNKKRSIVIIKNNDKKSMVRVVAVG